MSYSSYVHDILEISGAKEGDLLSIKGEGQELMGTLMPHHEFSHPDILIIKLRNGYNVGVRITPGTKVEMISKGSPKAKVSREQREAGGKKEVSFLGTGGTIASYVDYRTWSCPSRTLSRGAHGCGPWRSLTYARSRRRSCSPYSPRI